MEHQSYAESSNCITSAVEAGILTLAAKHNVALPMLQLVTAQQRTDEDIPTFEINIDYTLINSGSARNQDDIDELVSQTALMVSWINNLANDDRDDRSFSTETGRIEGPQINVRLMDNITNATGPEDAYALFSQHVTATVSKFIGTHNTAHTHTYLKTRDNLLKVRNGQLDTEQTASQAPAKPGDSTRDTNHLLESMMSEIGTTLKKAAIYFLTNYYLSTPENEFELIDFSSKIRHEIGERDGNTTLSLNLSGIIDSIEGDARAKDRINAVTELMEGIREKISEVCSAEGLSHVTFEEEDRAVVFHIPPRSPESFDIFLKLASDTYVAIRDMVGDINKDEMKALEQSLQYDDGRKFGVVEAAARADHEGGSPTLEIVEGIKASVVAAERNGPAV
jgi:hypothetical protein